MNIILASKSGVRKKILEDNKINFEVVHSHVDEDMAKESFINEGLLKAYKMPHTKRIKVRYHDVMNLPNESI